MCGIIGYSGHRPAVPLLVEGLHRLEYRGYDSSGVAFEQAGRLQVVKAAGKLSALEAKLEENAYMLATTGMGHTRWATHGLPVEKNAHPHLSQDGRIAIVHNGIIENFQEVKEELLAKGHTFLSGIAVGQQPGEVGGIDMFRTVGRIPPISVHLMRKHVADARSGTT